MQKPSKNSAKKDTSEKNSKKPATKSEQVQPGKQNTSKKQGGNKKNHCETARKSTDGPRKHIDNNRRQSSGKITRKGQFCSTCIGRMYSSVPDPELEKSENYHYI